jgi:hypothetical protein
MKPVCFQGRDTGLDRRTENTMRRSLWALMAIGVMAAANAAPAAAGGSPAGSAPFCLRGCDASSGGLGDCSFSSYQQCQATASGRTAWCASNPYSNANAEMLPGHGRMSRRAY